MVKINEMFEGFDACLNPNHYLRERDIEDYNLEDWDLIKNIIIEINRLANIKKKKGKKKSKKRNFF